MSETRESMRIGGPPAPGDAPPVLVVKPRRMRWEVPITVAAVGVLLVLGASLVGIFKGSDAKPPQAGASVSPSPSGIVDPHAREACQLNKEASDRDQLHDDGVVLRIRAEADKSSSQVIRFDAQMLVDQQAISNAEIRRGGGNLELALAVDQASIRMQTDCVKAGYY